MSELTQTRNNQVGGAARQIVGLLKTLGVPHQMLYVRRIRGNGSFWLRPINHLGVLEHARKLYRRQMLRVHPDRPGGCLERTIQLNCAWDAIERRFKEHGHELGN